MTAAAEEAAPAVAEATRVVLGDVWEQNAVFAWELDFGNSIKSLDCGGERVKIIHKGLGDLVMRV